MLPLKFVPVPRVAELPTWKKMLHVFAEPMVSTLELLAVVSVLPILKMNTAAGLPCPSSVSVPVSWAEELKQYTPGVRVRVPRSCPVSTESQACVTRPL